MCVRSPRLAGVFLTGLAGLLSVVAAGQDCLELYTVTDLGTLGGPTAAARCIAHPPREHSAYRSGRSIAIVNKRRG
jgi:hypothetical protein